MNQLRFISNVLYRMKRRYGVPVNFIKVLSENVDLTTGVKTQVRDSLQVNRVIVLPSLIHREFFYDLAWITGNKDFTYGGQTLTDTRKFVVDRADLGGWEIKIGDILVYDSKRYDVNEVDEFETRMGYLVSAKESESVVPSNVISVSLYDELPFTDSAVRT